MSDSSKERCRSTSDDPDRRQEVLNGASATDIKERRRTEDRIQLIIDTTPALIHSALPEGSLDYLKGAC